MLFNVFGVALVSDQGVISMIIRINKQTKFIVIIACLSAILMSCKENEIYTGSDEESQQYSFSEFIKNIQSFPYVADSIKINKVIDGFRKLTLGMGKNEAEALLGKPDAESFSYNTTKGNKTFEGSTWGYYLRRHETVYANEQYDQTLFLYFDPNEKLYWAHPNNIDNIQDKGGPHLKKR